VDSFEGIPDKPRLEQFFQTVLSEADAAAGPAAQLRPLYEQALEVSAGAAPVF
jgi:hypothetical protein